MANIETRKAPINIRALAAQRNLIDKAAAALRGRYEITVTFFTISLRRLMPERYFCVTVIV